MKHCPSCGTDNLDRSRFCEQCGTQLPESVVVAAPPPVAPDPEAAERSRAEQRERAAAGLPPTFMPPPVQPSFAPESGWKSLDPADEPPKKKRRLFLWIIGAILALCMLVCVAGFVFFGYTDTGKRLVNEAATKAAVSATEQAVSESIATAEP